MPSRVIELKFDIGDRVFAIAKKHIWNSSDVVCPVCNGTGTFIAPTTGTQRHCPGVAGYSCKDGHMIISEYKYFPYEIVIEEISIASESIYYIDGHGDPFSGIYYTDELYETMEEAQAVCDVKNGKENLA